MVFSMVHICILPMKSVFLSGSVLKCSRTTTLPSEFSFFKGIPILVIKIAEQKRRQSMKEGFWTFLEGTHPRLGEDSCVRLLSGHTPVIKMIRDYSLHQPQLCLQLVKADDQINNILRFLSFVGIGKYFYSLISFFFYRLCRVKSVLLEIAEIERQPLWAIGSTIYYYLILKINHQVWVIIMELSLPPRTLSISLPHYYNRGVFRLCRWRRLYHRV